MMQPLLDRWRRGDSEAFLELVRPHLVSLRAMAAFYGPPPGSLWEADDLAQDALLEAFKAAEEFDPARGDIRSWLGGILRNRLRRAWQEASRERGRQAAEAMRAAERAEPVEDRHVDALRRCMEKLNETGRRVVRAHYGEGLPCAEIAAQVKMSLSALYVMLHRLRRGLRECVEREGLGPEGARP